MKVNGSSVAEVFQLSSRGVQGWRKMSENDNAAGRIVIELKDSTFVFLPAGG